MDQGKARGKGIGQADKRFFTKEGLSGQENYYARESGVCISVGKELPDYTKTLAKREKIYQFIGVYTGGQQDENGRLLCEYWEVAIG